MDIFLVPVPPKKSGRKLSAEDRLWTARQDGRPLEKYVEEFAELSSKSLILFLNGSEFEVEEVQKRSYSPRPAPTETQVAWPVHQPLISSTYHSSGHSPMASSDLQPKPSKKRSNVSRRRHKKPAAASPKPPVPVGMLIEYEGMSWTPSPDPAPAVHEPAPAFHEPALILLEPDPILHGPAPAFHEPAPAFLEPAPGFQEPSPAADEPAPARLSVPAHKSRHTTKESPKKIVWGGHVP
ncbi:hypothetical protein DPX16_6044 [Anabarilius grahami]|uniref:Uncharacterized protein n=1 Tax=Anabarilius grahami TaxID=495550 RepID=A0A3N0Z0T5_ANAGA|nr:hypothetical protein DPX16_6044 [Anabarilius grahami]